MATDRIAYYDNMKAILILLVVVGHLLDDFAGAVGIHAVTVASAWIYTFHMPLFLFVSGLFARSCYSKERGFAAENVLFYLALYVIFQALKWLVHAVFLGQGFDASFDLFYVSAAPWYLLVLGLLTLCVPLFACLKPAWGIAIAVLLSVLNGWFNWDVTLLSLSRFFTYLPAFFIGYYIGSAKMTEVLKSWRTEGICINNRRIMSLKTLRYLAVAFLLVLYVVLYILPPEATTLIRHYSTGLHTFPEFAEKFPEVPYVIWGVLRVLHCGLILAIGVSLAAVTPFSSKGYFTVIGERSLQVYIFHMLILYYTRQFSFDAMMFEQFSWWVFVVPVEAVVLTCILALPKSPNRWVRSLKKACKAFVVK